MSATAASAPTPAAPAASFLARRPLRQVSCLSGLAAGVVVETWGLAARRRRAGEGRRRGRAARDAGHRRHVRDGDDGRHLLVHLRRLVMARFAGNPGRTCLRTALPLLAASLAVPLAAADTAIPAKLTLAAAALIAGAIIIPAVARRLSPAR